MMSRGKDNLTNQNRYCVRPNSGSIEPGKSVEVQGNGGDEQDCDEHLLRYL